jgi:hypothetical protein
MDCLSRFTVLAPVNLDHQSRGKTDEIGEIWSQGKLAPKTKTVDLFSS